MRNSLNCHANCLKSKDKKQPLLHSIFLFFCLQMLIVSNVQAAPRDSVQYFYIQVGLGVGLDLSFSNIMADEYGNETEGVGFQLTGRAHVGISNILEVEVQRQLAGSHYEFDSKTIKLNPFPSDYNTESEPFYLVFGTGNFYSPSDKKIHGESKVWGVEWAVMTYGRTYRLGIKYQSATLKNEVAQPSSIDNQAEMILMDISVAIGF